MTGKTNSIRGWSSHRLFEPTKGEEHRMALLRLLLREFAEALLGLLNMLSVYGGIVFGIWLAFLGEWGVIGYGLLAPFIVIPFIMHDIEFPMKPAAQLLVSAIALHERGKLLGAYFLTFLNALYSAAILTAWCIAVLYFFARQADTNSVIPVLLWSYCVASAPIMFLFQQEKRLEGGEEEHVTMTFMLTFCALLAYVYGVLAMLFFESSVTDVAVRFGAIMLIGLVLQICNFIKYKCDFHRSELLREYENGRRDFSGANLRDAILKRTDLSDANLRGANLQGANLSDAILKRANLQGANLRDADLTGSNLRGAILEGAMLESANLEDAVYVPPEFQK